MSEKTRVQFRRSLILRLVDTIGVPRGSILSRVNLKHPPAKPPFDRRNRRIMGIFWLDGREISFHATKGWRVNRAAA